MSSPASRHLSRYFMTSVIVASSICREQDNIPVKVVWRPLDQPWSQVPVLLKMRFVSFVALFVAARTGGARQICTKSSLIICKTLTGKKRLSRNLREQNSIRIKLLRDEWWRGENGNNKFESVHLQGEGNVRLYEKEEWRCIVGVRWVWWAWWLGTSFERPTLWGQTVRPCTTCFDNLGIGGWRAGVRESVGGK